MIEKFKLAFPDPESILKAIRRRREYYFYQGKTQMMFGIGEFSITHQNIDAVHELLAKETWIKNLIRTGNRFTIQWN